VQSVLGDRYVVERSIGRGGAATVYLARDTKHERAVAVKVLGSEIASLLGVDRFLHEIKLTSRLHHPHILPLFDSGDAEGCVYYVMPFVEGESLSDRLRREKSLAIEQALAITREVADALDYAHGQNIVHRDIKPGNILMLGNHALVADFGIARAISKASGPNWQTLTSMGVVLGTPAYMSPEQAVGDIQIDGRSDIYSLACMLYEMLVGTPPFAGPDGEVRTVRRFTEPAPSVRASRHAVSRPVDNAIAKALALDPADRFPTAREFVASFSPSAGAHGIASGLPAAKRRDFFTAAAGLAAIIALVTLWAVSAQRASAPPTSAPMADAPITGRSESASISSPLSSTSRDPPLRAADSARDAALSVRRRASEAGATIAELARGDAELDAAERLARDGRFADAMVRLRSATTAWTETERSLLTPLAVIESVVRDFARAVEWRDARALRAAFPGLPAPAQGQWEMFFDDVRTISAKLAITDLHVAVDTAYADVIGSYEYVPRGSTYAERAPLKFRVSLRREAGIWLMSSIR
jgi:serine/threonine protein kinase